jgi:hypothetical protein
MIVCVFLSKSNKINPQRDRIINVAVVLLMQRAKIALVTRVNISVPAARGSLQVPVHGVSGKSHKQRIHHASASRFAIASPHHGGCEGFFVFF